MKLASPLRGALVRTGKFGLRAAGAGGTKAAADHQGVDIRAAIGTPVRPMLAGEVVQIRRRFPSLASEGSSIFSARMAGNIVVVRTGDLDVNYAHLGGVAHDLAVGDRVGLDDVIATSGVTGVSQPHLHAGIHRRVTVGGRTAWLPVDPTPYLPWTADKFGELTIGAPSTATPTPAQPQAITEEEIGMFVPNLYINKSPSGPKNIGIAIYATGLVLPLKNDQWDALKMAGAPARQVTVKGHWEFLQEQAAKVRATFKVEMPRLSDADLARISLDLAAEVGGNLEDVVRSVLEAAAPGSTVSDADVQRIAKATVDQFGTALGD